MSDEKRDGWTFDPKRYKGHTEGPWGAGEHPASTGQLNIVRPVMLGNRVGKLPECEGGAAYFRNAADARLVADAPRLLREVERLQAQIEKASCIMLREARFLHDECGEGTSFEAGERLEKAAAALSGEEADRG